MPDTGALIGRAAASAADVVAGVRDDRMSDPTPCAAFDVRALAGHMAGFVPMTASAARKEPLPSGDPGDLTGDGWRERYAADAARAGEAWASPGALDGTTRFGPGEFPAGVAASITLMELVVHGWDLARATGQELAVDPEVAETLATLVGPITESARGGDSFAAPVPVPADAPALDRALAATGRDPRWTPARARATAS